jgi:hypothetical protein
VFAASRQHGDLAHASQMTREEAPDDARPDDADPFHALRRVSQRGDMSVKRCCPQITIPQERNCDRENP